MEIIKDNKPCLETEVLHVDQFDYLLPSHLIAQEPLSKRDQCKLMHVPKEGSEIRHVQFKDILKILRKGDRLVLNDTRVIPARVFARKENGLRIEFLFVEKKDDLTWAALVGPARRLPVGATAEVENCPGCFLKIESVLANGDRVVSATGARSIEQIIEDYGSLPLPHYIERNENEMDRESYQTVFARNSGAVAAPTAGLHFTDELLNELSSAGIDISFLTLHVGIGTFRPVKHADPRMHDMHEERYILSSNTVEQINNTSKNGGRIIAVGTTVVRVLEHCALKCNELCAGEGKTKLLILPPYEFRVVDGLITNFHLPKSTLLMLVCAFGGRNKIMEAYNNAVKYQYRFYSYGDAMIVL